MSGPAATEKNQRKEDKQKGAGEPAPLHKTETEYELIQLQRLLLNR